MAKFKVGDKVRTPLGDGEIIETRCGEPEYFVYGSNLMGHGSTRFPGKTGNHFCWLPENKLTAINTRREFIVIRRSGAETIAELRRDHEVIKSAKATCAPSDTFDLDTGAKLAFDRLMGRLNPLDVGKTITIPRAPSVTVTVPQPAHRFNVGDRVAHPSFGVGTIVKIRTDIAPEIPYLVKFADEEVWVSEPRLCPAPAPEPPKFYTGKVFAEKTDSVSPSIKSRNGFVFEIKDGRLQMSDERAFNLSMRTGSCTPFKSFEEFKESHRSTTWHEVKSDV